MTRFGEKRIATCILMIITMVFVVACGSGNVITGVESVEGTESEQTGSLFSSAASAGKVGQGVYTSVVSCGETSQILRDCCGREVEVPLMPDSVAALDSFAGEAMIMVGAGEKITAVPNGVKSDKLLLQICPSVADASVPMSGGTFNAESLLAISPDVILIKGALYESKDECSKLDKLNIPYLVVGYTNMEEQMYALQLTGDAAGGNAKKMAAKINEYYSSVIEKAHGISVRIPDDERVRVYHSINEVVRTDGPDTLGYDWITCTGAENVSASESLTFSESDYFAGAEQIFQWDPDVVICNEVDTKDYLLSNEKWTGLRAVYEENVYNIPVGATRWGQRGSLETYFAILWLGTTIYPVYYSDVNLQKEVTSFYADYLGVTIDDDMYQKMISGRGIRGSSSAAGN